MPAFAFFEKFIDGKLHPDGTPLVDCGELNLKQSFVPFHLKQKAVACFKDRLPELLETSVAEETAQEREGPPLQLNDDSSPGDILLGWRRELWTLRKAYASLDGVTRQKVWADHPLDETPEGEVSAYPPFELAALRTTRMTKEEKAQFKLSDEELVITMSTKQMIMNSHTKVCIHKHVPTNKHAYSRTHMKDSLLCICGRVYGTIPACIQTYPTFLFSKHMLRYHVLF